MNFGALSVRYYLEKNPEILDLTYDFGTLEPDIDSMGGCGFKLFGHTFLITIDTLNTFQIAVITSDQDLIFASMGDHAEFEQFLNKMKLSVILYNKNLDIFNTFDSYFNIDE